MASKIPPLLEPYLALPQEASLILLTSVLGASTNWLALRFLYSALANPEDEDVKVVFVSFMRDLAFWKDGCKRLVFIIFIRNSFCTVCHPENEQRADISTGLGS